MRAQLIAALRDARMPRGDDLPEHGRVPRAVIERLFAELIASTRGRLRGDATVAAS